MTDEQLNEIRRRLDEDLSLENFERGARSVEEETNASTVLASISTLVAETGVNEEMERDH